MGAVITAQSLISIMPGVPRKHAETYAKYLNSAMLEGNLTTKNRAAYFLAQIAHESNDLVWMEELASGAEYEGRRDLGNAHSGDGKRFKGRGPIQLTGRANYRAAGKALGAPLEAQPSYAAEPRFAFRVAVWFWTTHHLNTIADAGNFELVTRVINGGLNGYADRNTRLARILRHKPTQAYLPGTRTQRLRRRLKR